MVKLGVVQILYSNQLPLNQDSPTNPLVHPGKHNYHKHIDSNGEFDFLNPAIVSEPQRRQLI